MAAGTDRRHRGSLARAALWTAFAALVLVGGWLFLRACGTLSILGWARNFCPIPAQSAFDRDAAEGESLRRQVHAAEMALAETPPCPAPAPVATPPAPVPAPHVAPQRSTESRRLDESVRRRGGKEGRLQFTLAWNTRDDLDINVDCPGGRIGSLPGQKGPGICGDGIKDIDANRNLVENVSSSPIENISWSEDVPDGTYTIEIIEYRAQANRGSTVPFTLRMRWRDQEKICSSVVTTLSQAEVMGSISTTRGTYQTIEWRKGTDLPDCTFVQQNAIAGPAK